MGRLIDGKWKDEWYDTKSSGGRFERKQSAFRDWVRADGSTRFAPQNGRYHLYVSLACPWAHRTLIFRKLKGLEAAISISIVDPFMGANGWEFGSSDGCIPDMVNNTNVLHEVYTKADSNYSGRVTVPVLWDKETRRIVNNESAEIIRMFNSAFDGITGNTLDFYPPDLRVEIDMVNGPIYDDVNNGVYKSGFATTQAAYDLAVTALFAELDRLEERLTRRRYLTGERITEADWRLFTTLVRFDAVYVGHFKCNRQRIADYQNLSGYLRDLYQVPGVSDTVNMTHIKRHYYESHQTINPTAVVPLGPELNLDAPHGREQL